MPIIIKEMHVRTVVERRIVTEAELPEEILRRIEDRVAVKAGSLTHGGRQEGRTKDELNEE